jgi:dipeptidyl aminopeptidase/acylaminoacyl peptidase
MYIADIQNEDLTVTKIYEAQYPSYVSISYTPWSADGEWVTFVQRDESNYSIQLLNATSYRIYSVPVDISNGALLHWSPDGHFLSYISSQEQNLCFLTFTQLQEVATATPKCFELPDADLYQDFVWSPDNRSVLFTTYNNNDGPEEHHLGLLGVSGDEIIPLNWNLTSDLQYSTGGLWSPNGQNFAFTSDFSIESTSKLFVANSAGAERRELLSVESPYAIYGIEWSSDSKSIVANVAQFFSYDPIQVEYQLHLINIQNGVKKVLLTAPQISSFDWQP